MKVFALLFVLLGFLNFAAAEVPVLTWVGQFPKEQAGPVVELFNSHYATEAGFKVVYNSSDAAIADILAGKVDPQFDIVHMKDADMLNTLAVKGLSEPLRTTELKAWPTHLKDSRNMWVGLLKRSRIIYYNSELVSPNEVQTYESLGDAKFKGKLCVRQKKAQYTIGLHSFLLGVWGEQKTAQVLKSWAVNSEALPLIEKDLEGVIAGIENGNCLVGIANTYYYMRHLRAHPNTKVKAVIPNQNDIGAHVNVDGVAILNSSANKDAAQAFAAWLMSDAAQMELSKITDKHPVSPHVTSPELLQVFGTFKDNSSFDLNNITDLKERASAIATEQGLK
ncbi:extracellular solute-binding protein [Bdellovibrio sp. HCB2-146]|uniref:extracellular solute-binding protein n=1 Tax=Bdellovibrio sp. HCB2-146 TaxID=3394362 RepID=UPI0039BCD52E